MKIVFAALDQRLDPVSPAPIVVALSGGGDSLALLYLAMDWARLHERRVLALTIDHGLNPDSADWTLQAGAKAGALGADWRGLKWEGPKPTTGLQARARAARHALLADAARQAGARVILVGHTADDVAEGDVMRAEDTPGLGRLREWSPSPVWPEGRGVFLLRPLLAMGRAQLRDYLAEKDATWLDDPANEDRRFARVRARQTLNSTHPRQGGDSGFFPSNGIADAQACVPASAVMSGEVVFDEAGATAPSSLSGAALAALLLCVSGGATPPRGAALVRLREVIAKDGVATLCGCRVEARGGHVRIVREPPRRGSAACPLEPVAWAAQRFHAACGLYADEASIPPAL